MPTDQPANWDATRPNYMPGMDAAGIDTPDAGDDKLREQLARTIEAHTERCSCCPTIKAGETSGLLDALLPLIREHTAAAVQAERERAAEILDGCNDRTAELAERIDVLATDVMEREAAVQRVRALATGRRGFTAADVLAALDGTEVTG